MEIALRKYRKFDYTRLYNTGNSRRAIADDNIILRDVSSKMLGKKNMNKSFGLRRRRYIIRIPIDIGSSYNIYVLQCTCIMYTD